MKQGPRHMFRKSSTTSSVITVLNLSSWTDDPRRLSGCEEFAVSKWILSIFSRRNFCKVLCCVIGRSCIRTCQIFVSPDNGFTLVSIDNGYHCFSEFSRPSSTLQHRQSISFFWTTYAWQAALHARPLYRCPPVFCDNVLRASWHRLARRSIGNHGDGKFFFEFGWYDLDSVCRATNVLSYRSTMSSNLYPPLSKV